MMEQGAKWIHMMTNKEKSWLQMVWLQVRRSLFAPKNPLCPDVMNAFAARTETRRRRGGPPVRYEAGVQYARETIEIKRQAALVAPILRRLDRKYVKLPHNSGTNSTF